MYNEMYSKTCFSNVSGLDQPQIVIKSLRLLLNVYLSWPLIRHLKKVMFEFSFFFFFFQ
jgi:sensor histidine kinase regulating citrate/malate metabolism